MPAMIRIARTVRIVRAARTWCRERIVLVMGRVWSSRDAPYAGAGRTCCVAIGSLAMQNVTHGGCCHALLTHRRCVRRAERPVQSMESIIESIDAMIRGHGPIRTHCAIHGVKNRYSVIDCQPSNRGGRRAACGVAAATRSAGASCRNPVWRPSRRKRLGNMTRHVPQPFYWVAGSPTMRGDHHMLNGKPLLPEPLSPLSWLLPPF